DIKILSESGPMVDDNADPVSEVDRKLEKDAVESINKFKPQLLFVAMKNPKQEIWIYKSLSMLNVGGAMTVGGTFRYISGKSLLPPKWMENYGLEWVYRLITEPYRIKRIFNAFPIFHMKVFWLKISTR
ncbi:MAG: WecB/TagA/CpsF family glycosyltransferase, partial [bacterium]|nr:WecB/TagA/CpsF family glycosyltransferase [bacterium]